MVTASDYPSPDPKFQEQAIALMKQKQDQLNQEYQEQEVNEAEVEKPKAKTTKKTTSKSARGKKTVAKKGTSIKKSEIETPSVERKPYYIEAEIIAGGAVVGFFAAHRNRPGLEITWSNPRYSSDLEGLMISGANIIEDGQVVDSIDPNTENWRFIENFQRLFLGHPFSGGIIREIDEVE